MLAEKISENFSENIVFETYARAKRKTIGFNTIEINQVLPCIALRLKLVSVGWVTYQTQPNLQNQA